MRRNSIGTALGSWLLTGLLGALWTGVILWAMVAIYILSPFGIRDRAAARQQMSEEIRIEDQGFCEKFGLPVGTQQYGQCVFGLQTIRENERRRAGCSEQELL